LVKQGASQPFQRPQDAKPWLQHHTGPAPCRAYNHSSTPEGFPEGFFCSKQLVLAHFVKHTGFCFLKKP
jgi:hypothetical protein